MPARVSFTTVACTSVGDAARLAASFQNSWAGPGPKPDLIEINNAEVDLTWFSLSAPPPSAAITAGALATGAKFSYSHTDGKNRTSGSGN